MSSSPTVCLFCRLRWLVRSNKPSIPPLRSRATVPTGQWRAFGSTAQRRQQHEGSNAAGQVEGQTGSQPRWKPHGLHAEAGKAEDVSDVESVQVPADGLEEHGEEARPAGSILSQQTPTPEFVAHAARQTFGDRLPEGVLTEEQYRVYERLYGKPLQELDEHEALADEDTRDVLYKEGTDGMLEELGVLEPDLDPSDAALALGQYEDELSPAEDYERPNIADAQLHRDIAASIATQASSGTELTVRSPDELTAYEEPEISEDEEDDGPIEIGGDSRAHPFTVAARFGTIPSALPLPRSSFVDPIAHLLSNVSNKHLDEAASRIFEGPSIPYSPSTPYASRTKPQKPIPLNAGQSKMSDIEADVFMAAIMPQTYAAVMSALVETRKRLGAPWLEKVLRREGGPRILDVGAAGAGVIAWREVLKAEWKRMNDLPQPDANNTKSASDQQPTRDIPPAPIGKATVLTGSHALRLRASTLLENTTFLPRLPDYVHATFPSEDSQRKQFDVIVVSHSLWHLHESYERRQLVKNLWSFLDPNGGVLILVEKGVPRGFEVIADARAYILSQLFEKEHGAAQDLDEPAVEAEPEVSSGENPVKTSRRSPGHIVAPCPHSQKCPLYLVPGVSRQRKDWCHFRQRYIRPSYLQRLLGAKDRNFEDVEFSYVAVQKGFRNQAPLLGDDADERAFTGYDIDDMDVFQQPEKVPHPFGVEYVDRPPRIPNPLPRLLLAPLKRQGHIHLDMCTPAGTFSRWTVPRSYGKQAYRDARKASWGDLWALGAKQKEGRRVRLGLKAMAAGVSTGRGIENKAKVQDMAKGPIRDVKARPSSSKQSKDEGGSDTANFGEREERIARRRAAKDRGREKARSRRREETKALFERAADG